MTIAITTRRLVGLGEAIRFETGRDFAVYIQVSGEWRRASGWRSGAALTADGAIDSGVVDRFAGATAAGLTVAPDAVDALRTAGLARVRIVQYDDSDRIALQTDFALAPGPADLESAIEVEEAYLAVLIAARIEAADTDGVARVHLPNNRMEEYWTPAALDRRVAEIRARIAWFREGAGGNQLPGLTLW